MEKRDVPEGYLFSNRDLRRLIVPLILEQCLAISVGLFDSIMVSSIGQEAVSAVSLIDNIMVLIVNAFTALATGGAIVAGQYLGKKEEKEGCRAVEQTLLVCLGTALLIMSLAYLFKGFILNVVFGRIEPEVMRNCNTYLLITLAAVPFIALQNVGAAVFRGMGNSRTPMLISLLVNVLNVSGNALLLYGLKFGIEGAAIPTLVSRVIGAVVILRLLKNRSNVLHIQSYRKIRPNGPLSVQIMKIGIPYGMENSMFQLGKIILLSLITSFGTNSITANAVGNTISNFGILAGVAISYTLSAVTAQCVGARDYEQVRYYTRKLIRYSYFAALVLNALILLAMPVIIAAYHLPEETVALVWKVMLCQVAGTVTFWSPSFNLPNVLRASNDGTFCMVVSLISMWVFRVGCSFYLARLGFGVLAVWIAMCIDWVARSICFVVRYRGTRWQLSEERI